MYEWVAKEIQKLPLHRRYGAAKMMVAAGELVHTIEPDEGDEILERVRQDIANEIANEVARSFC